MNGGRFDFDDGGTYVGSWEEGKAHGHGVCTGPQSKGEYAGAWHYGFEVSGVYTWPSGNTYKGQWQNGKRHGLGVETRGRWVYQGEWTQGLKGRYGQRLSLHSQANYMGTWSAGLHDGYGTETYVDGGTYKGQWLRGMRHGYGIRISAAYGTAAKHRSRSHTNASLTSLRSEYGDEEIGNGPTGSKNKSQEEEDDSELRGGFVLRARSDAPAKRRRSLSERSLAVKRSILSNLRIKKQHSTGDIHQRVTSMTGSLRSSGSTMSCTSDDSEHHRNVSDLGSRVAPAEERIEPSVTESYKGEWKNDKRSGYGICERSDGLKYAGEWLNNKKHGYGITSFTDGTKEEGRYKNNVLVCSTRRRGLMFVRSSKLRERIEASVEAARRAAEMAAARVDIAESRTMTAHERSEMAQEVAARAQDDADTARIHAAQFDPGFRQPGIEIQRQSRNRVLHNHAYANHVSFESTTSAVQHHSRGVTPVTQQHYVEPSQQYLASQRIQPQHGQFYAPQQTPNRIAEPHHQLDGVPGPSHAYDSQGMEHAAMAQQYSQAGQYGYQQPTEAHSNRASASEHSLHSTAPGSSYHIAEGVHANPQLYQQSTAHQQATADHQLPNKSHLMPDGRLMGNNVGPGGSRQHLASTSAAEADYGASPRLSHILRNNPEGSSMMSLSDDHFDQYVINRPNAEARLRRNRPSLTRQSEVVGDASHRHEIDKPPGVPLISFVESIVKVTGVPCRISTSWKNTASICEEKMQHVSRRSVGRKNSDFAKRRSSCAPTR
ncbi:junctophilin [Aphelenchoides avenae]|nr:junctophilin [Aphelenchus avenae]